MSERWSKLIRDKGMLIVELVEIAPQPPNTAATGPSDEVRAEIRYPSDFTQRYTTIDGGFRRSEQLAYEPTTIDDLPPRVV